MILNVSDKNIRLAYKGPFYIDVLSSLGSYIREMFSLHPLASNRLYKLFFELTQNVAKYSAETSSLKSYKYSGIGSFYLEESETSIIISTSNLIRNEDGPVLEKYCNEINFMNKQELRDYKNEKRKTMPQAKDTGAQIGIIQIGILTHNQVECKVHKHDDIYSVFSIAAKVEKE